MALGDDDKALFHFEESARLRPLAVSAEQDALTVPTFRFRHNLDQMSALDERQKLGADASACLNAFKAVWSESDGVAQTVSVTQQSEHFEPVAFSTAIVSISNLGRRFPAVHSIPI